MKHGGARFRESEVNVPRSGYKHQGLAGGPLLSLSLSLSLSLCLSIPSHWRTQVAGQPDNARSPDKASLIVPISGEEWIASLPLTISFVICIRLIKITMNEEASAVAASCGDDRRRSSS